MQDEEFKDLVKRTEDDIELLVELIESSYSADGTLPLLIEIAQKLFILKSDSLSDQDKTKYEGIITQAIINIIQDQDVLERALYKNIHISEKEKIYEVIRKVRIRPMVSSV